MGMFDSVIINWRGADIELQTKEFECSLRRFRLGDLIVPGDKGVKTFTISFAADMDHLLGDSVIPLFDDTRHFIGVLKDGFLLDYAISPVAHPPRGTGTSPKDVLLGMYLEPVWCEMAWKSILMTKIAEKDAQQSVLYKFFNFVNAFGRRHERRNVSLFRALDRLRGVPPRKDLTFKNLVAKSMELEARHRQGFFQKSDFHTWESLFWRNPESGDAKTRHPILDLLESHPLGTQNAEQALLKALSELDFSAFEAVHSMRGEWWKLAGRDFNLELERVLSASAMTHWGSMVWLRMQVLLQGRPPGTFCYHGGAGDTHQQKSKLSDFRLLRVPAWIHFTEVVGVDEDWLLKAINTVPEILTYGTLPSPVVTVPVSYEQTSTILLNGKTWKEVSHEADADGMTPLMRCLQTYSYIEAAIWIERGSDPNAVDTHGNTALMRLVQHLGRHSFAPPEEGGSSAIRLVVKHLLSAHSFEHRNDRQQTLSDLWPGHSNAREVWALEERGRLVEASIPTAPGADRPRM